MARSDGAARAVPTSYSSHGRPSAHSRSRSWRYATSGRVGAIELVGAPLQAHHDVKGRLGSWRSAIAVTLFLCEAFPEERFVVAVDHGGFARDAQAGVDVGGVSDAPQQEPHEASLTGESSMERHFRHGIQYTRPIGRLQRMRMRSLPRALPPPRSAAALLSLGRAR